MQIMSAGLAYSIHSTVPHGTPYPFFAVPLPPFLPSCDALSPPCQTVSSMPASPLTVVEHVLRHLSSSSVTALPSADTHADIL